MPLREHLIPAILEARASRVVQSVAQFGNSGIKPHSELHTLAGQILVRTRLVGLTTHVLLWSCPVRFQDPSVSPWFSLTWQYPCNCQVKWASGPELFVSHLRRMTWFEHFRG